MVLLWFAQQLRQPDGTLDQKTGGPVTVRRSPLFIKQGDQRFLSDLALFPFDYAARAPMFESPSALIVHSCVDVVSFLLLHLKITRAGAGSYISMTCGPFAIFYS